MSQSPPLSPAAKRVLKQKEEQMRRRKENAPKISDERKLQIKEEWKRATGTAKIYNEGSRDAEQFFRTYAAGDPMYRCISKGHSGIVGKLAAGNPETFGACYYMDDGVLKVSPLTWRWVEEEDVATTADERDSEAEEATAAFQDLAL
tara:strand:- start:168 stop:608 length:441 start_codon:yes stop_codon:yes gene_type:complete